MMKGLIFTISFIFLLSFVSGAVLDIEKIDKGSVIIADTKNPAKFLFLIENNGASDDFEIYSLIGVTMTPKGTFFLQSGQETPIDVSAYLNDDLRNNNRGIFIFDYEIKSPKNGITKDRLQIKIVDLKDVLSISTEPIDPEDTTATIKIKNKENTILENARIEIKSKFFETEQTISLLPKEEIQIPVEINRNKISRLSAGNYEISATIEYEKAEAKIKGEIKYLEKGKISVSEQSSGVIIRKHVTQKTNEGNIQSEATITAEKNILSRLFTSSSIQPTSVSRRGLFVEYIWTKQLSPGETFEVTTTTNYTLPWILLIIVVLGTLAVKIYTSSNVSLQKNVSFVKTRGGELALKVTIKVKARKHVNRLQIVDRLPGMTKLYEKFGIPPSRIDHQTRRIFWDIPSLSAGESRIFSYVMYSSIKVVGKFELPSATAIYEHEGKTHETFSNTTYFVAETTNSD